jgi:hypothetical protein
MGLDSLLASLKSGVTKVTEVQVSSNNAFACNPTKIERVTEDTNLVIEIYTATHETLPRMVEVTAKSAPVIACTHETLVTPKTINGEVCVEDTKTTSRWWLIQYLNCDLLEVAYFPNATHSEVLKHYPESEIEPFIPTIKQPLVPLAFDEETLIREWLAQIDETDRSTIDEVIHQCQIDATARSYFIDVAEADKSQKQLSAIAFDDDRRTCYQCLNLTGLRRSAAKRDEMKASRNYEPIRYMRQRCEGYLPNVDDPDRRPGRERWQNLFRKGGK